MVIRYFFNSLLGLLLFLSPLKAVLGQSGRTGDLAKKRVSDTIFRQRMMVVPDPFDANHALRQLFPGKWYALRPPAVDRLISWVCPACKSVVYADANAEEDPVGFPYRDGVATRLIRVFSYTDSNGMQCKLISFNHSQYDPDGFQTCRFSGGLLGMAKFVRVDSGWRLNIFQPAIAAYGSFSQCPVPEPVLIGDHQSAYMIKHVNGGPGGPFQQDNYLLAEVGNSYRQILAAHAVGRSEGGPGVSKWTCTYRVLPEEKKLFRDIVLVSKGHYFASDKEGLPEELKGKVKGNEQGNFKIIHVFTYSGEKGYRERQPAKVLIER